MYTIEEVTDYLNGYDTWAVDQNVTEEKIDDIIEMDQETSVTDLKPLVSSVESGGEEEALTVSATFINQPSADPETQILTGIKVWDDAGDVFGKRPDKIEVTVYREADSQPGQDNEITRKALEDTDYTITWNKDKEGYWTYTITGAGGKGLPRYAPNGMEWEYTVEETHIDSYTAVKDTASENGDPTEDESTGDLVQSMTDLENSIMTSEPFSKHWVDSDGDEITEDYLGYELEVTFTLQVREISDAGNTKWQDAETYFEGALSDEVFSDLFNGYSFTQTLGGRLGVDLWNTGGSFKNLPGWIVKDGTDDTAADNTATKLEYRVVESCITVTGTNYKQEITVENNEDGETYTYSFAAGLFSAYYGEDKNSHESGNNTQYNQLETTDLKITKVWAGDKNNQYGTRPEAGEDSVYDWQVSFLIQRSSDGGTAWEPVMVSEEAGTSVPLIVEIYGANTAGTVSRTVSGLPGSGLSEDGIKIVNYQYRAVELNPLLESDEETGYTKDNLENYMVKASGTYADTYTASYDYSISNATKVTNTMVTTDIYAEKSWESNGGVTEPVSLTLQYLSLDEDGEEIWTDVSPEEIVELDGQADAESADKDYGEYDAWKAKWTDLPEVLPGSVTDESGKTQYRVTESALPGYETDYEYGETTDETGDSTIITNRKVTSLTVEKIWAVADESEIQEVTVGLWRTTGMPGDENEEEVLASDGAQMTLTLNSQNNWTDTFEGLPEYGGSESGAKKYVYYAREIRIGTGDGAVQIEDVKSDSQYAGDWKIVHVQDTQNKKTTIYNIGRTDLTVTKTWKDDGDAYGTRPETLELTLQRTVTPDEETSWVEVTAETLEEEKASFEWSGQEGNEWTYVYSDLLAADESGQEYTYRVVEKNVPEEYDSVQNGNNITNTLNDTIEITVTKEWLDGSDQDGLRSESVTLILYQNGIEYDTVTLTKGNLLQRLIRTVTGSSDSWSYTFSELPEYDENGVRYQYTVKEASVPDGYQADGAGDGTAQGSAEEGFTVTNILTTEVKVQKVWQGTDAGEQKEVTVGLYRSTEGSDGLPVAVTDESGDPLTLTLSDANGWKGTFENLPRFDEEGTRYLYTVKEETVGENPAEESGFVVHTDGGQITEADGTVLVWTGTDTDVWTYTYSGLPLTDDEGNLYTYRVEEIIPDGYEADTDGYDFTNTLSGTVDIPVTKVWEDNNNSNGKRPEEIELILYANGVEVQRVKVGADTGTLEALWNRATSGTDNTWEYAFSGLPRYDENGAEIAYTVQEVVPDGYRVDYGKGDNTITNVKRGSGSTGSDDSSDEENAVMAVSAAVPTGSVKTGDSARILLWTAAAVLSAAVLTVIGVYAYRRRKK